MLQQMLLFIDEKFSIWDGQPLSLIRHGAPTQNDLKINATLSQDTETSLRSFGFGHVCSF